MSLGSYAGATDTGRKRRRNEDSYVVAPPLFAIADGMGGAQAGEVASKLAAGALEEVDSGLLSGPERVTSLIQDANRRVYERASADPTASGMGTTMTVALLEGAEVTIGHVGDSRAYLVRDGELKQLTDDHSLVNELLKSGKLSPEEAETHPQRSVITRALGTEPDVDVDAFTIETRAGDLFLLCSDGLTSMVDDDEIFELLDRNRDDLNSAVRSLLAAANRGGGEDNITVVAFAIAVDGGDTATMPAIGREDDTLHGISTTAAGTLTIPEKTVENVLVLESDSPEAQAAVRRDPRTPTARTRLVLTMVALLAAAAVLLVWGFVR
jgi:protein phosphatase